MLKCSKIQEYAFMQFFQVTYPIDIVDDTIERIYLRCSTDEEVHH